MAGFRTVEVRIPEDAGIGTVFRVARYLAGMRPKDAAEALGLSQSSYQRIESGERQPRAAEVIAFAQITGQSIELFTDVEPGVIAALSPVPLASVR